MAEMPTLTVEFGGLDPFLDRDLPTPGCPEYFDRACAQILELQHRCRETHGLELDCVPYDGGEGILLGGGGRGDQPFHNCTDFVRGYNERGIGVMVPLNGGVLLDPEHTFDIVGDERFRNEMAILELLERNSHDHDVKNWVTIYRDELLGVIEEHFPSLGTMASCIRFVGGKQGVFKGLEEYRRAFEMFDRVVPLNQHSMPLFLSQFGAEAIAKMMIFLNLPCSSNDLFRCYGEYINLESTLYPDWGVQPHEMCRLQREDFTSIPPAEGFPSRSCNWRGVGGDLSAMGRREHLGRMIQMGVNRFKMPRRDFGQSALGLNSLGVLLQEFLRLHQLPGHEEVLRPGDPHVHEAAS